MKVNGFDPSIKAEGLIAQALSKGKFPHATIIEGGSPEQRLCLATKIATALVCADGDAIPCGVCSHCIKAQKKVHPDIYIKEPRKEHNTINEGFAVEYVREIRDLVIFMPNEANKKVIILTETQLMNENAQNALLKVLEEPPEFAHFILLVSTKNIFLETIISRATAWSLGIATDNAKNKIPMEKLLEVAENVALSLTKNSDLEIIKVAGVFDKDKKLLQATLPVMEEIFADALRIKFNASLNTESETANILAQKLSQKTLLRLIECTTELRGALKQNANQNLTVARLCSLFRAAVKE